MLKGQRSCGRSSTILSNQNELLTIERDGLQSALNSERGKPKKGKPLPLIQRREIQTRTQWWSPRAINEAQHLQAIFEQEEKDEEVRKADKRALQESNRLIKQKPDAERKEAAKVMKEEATKKRAVKAQQQAERKAER